MSDQELKELMFQGLIARLRESGSARIESFNF
jgi:hypothetical protein